MAKQKGNTATAAAVDPNAAAGITATNGEAGANTKAPRKPVNPDEVLSFDKGQDAVLIATLLDNPGAYTTETLAKALAAHPAFAGMAALASKRAPEKLRQRVKRLSKYSLEQYGRTLDLKKRSNAGYDSTDTLDEVFRSRGIGRVAGTVASTPPPSQAAVQPIPGPLAGGLIPVPQG